VNTAAKDETTSGLLAVLPETRVRSVAPKNTTAIGANVWISSTLRWGSWQIYDGTAADRLVGLDYFGARYFSAAQGRFTSPDPLWIKIDRLLDPQRLNLYAYGRNNPLKFGDPTGMDVVLGKCAGGDTQKCFGEVLRTVPEKDRSHIHLVTGDGKNGFQKGQYGITVDKDYKSASGNFRTLQTAANNHDGVAMLNVVAAKEGFASNVGVQQGGSVTLQSFKSIYGVDNYVSAKDAVPGQTLFPLIGSPLKDTIYTPGSSTQVFVANDQPEMEIVKTLAHELVHVVLGDFGRTVPKSAEDAPGVKPQLNRAEQEAEKNFRNQ
jgi:RHS repeat-associated protein